MILILIPVDERLLATPVLEKARFQSLPLPVGRQRTVLSRSADVDRSGEERQQRRSAAHLDLIDRRASPQVNPRWLALRHPPQLDSACRYFHVGRRAPPPGSRAHWTRSGEGGIHGVHESRRAPSPNC